jgi:hypothetical protein
MNNDDDWDRLMARLRDFAIYWRGWMDENGYTGNNAEDMLSELERMCGLEKEKGGEPTPPEEKRT